MNMGVREYARHRGVTHTAVTKALKSGRIQKEADGLIDPVKADRAWEGNTDPALQREPARQIATAPPPPRPAKPIEDIQPRLGSEPQETKGVPNYALSRAVKEAYAAKLLRIEYEQKMGNLLEAAVVTKEAFEVASRTRDRLEKIPSQVSAELTAMTDRRAIETLLAKEIRSALEEIAG
ncbi:MAG: hypothetical protein HQL91_13485 [Magnetococcales bacterium]|nr:hypothetical protein [Magnetococcales bacterium]